MEIKLVSGIRKKYQQRNHHPPLFLDCPELGRDSWDLSKTVSSSFDQKVSFLHRVFGYLPEQAFHSSVGQITLGQHHEMGIRTLSD